MCTPQTATRKKSTANSTRLKNDPAERGHPEFISGSIKCHPERSEGSMKCHPEFISGSHNYHHLKKEGANCPFYIISLAFPTNFQTFSKYRDLSYAPHTRAWWLLPATDYEGPKCDDLPRP